MGLQLAHNLHFNKACSWFFHSYLYFLHWLITITASLPIHSCTVLNCIQSRPLFDTNLPAPSLSEVKSSRSPFPKHTSSGFPAKPTPGSAIISPGPLWALWDHIVRRYGALTPAKHRPHPAQCASSITNQAWAHYLWCSSGSILLIKCTLHDRFRNIRWGEYKRLRAKFRFHV